MDYYDILIIGAGPVGLTIGKYLETFKLAFIFPRESLNFTTINTIGDFRLSSNSATGSFGGNSIFWASQHDVDVQSNDERNTFSNLETFPFSVKQLEAYQTIAGKMGWPVPATPKYRWKKLTPQFPISNIVKLRRRLPRKFRYSQGEKIPCQSIELISKDQNDNYVVKVDERLMAAKFIIFASGGISNTYFVELALKTFYPTLAISESFLGKGFTGHPKFPAAYVSTKKFFKFRKRTRRGYLIPTYRLSEISNFRLLPSVNSSRQDNLFERVLRKLGYARHFQIMIYFEPAQLANNSLRVISVSTSEISIFVDYSFDPGELLAYERSVNLLFESLQSNHHVRSIRKEKFDNHVLQLDQYHYFGATRMGVDSKTSVVDGFGRVHETCGIYVAGTSVLPLSRAEHPTYLAILVALRTAAQIRERLLNGHTTA